MIKKFLLIAGVSVTMMTSCILSQTYQITGNPIGTKTGVAKSNVVGTGDFGIKAAAKNGNITKIGAVEVTMRNSIIITKVYGE